MTSTRPQRGATASLGTQLILLLLVAFILQIASIDRFSQSNHYSTSQHRTTIAELKLKAQSQRPQRTQYPTFPPSPSTTLKRPLIVAYCGIFDSRKRGYVPPPTPHLSVISRFFGPHVFPDREFVARPVLASALELPSNTSATSPEGLRMLGLTDDVSVRICQLGGGAEMSRTLRRIPGAQVQTISAATFATRLQKRGLTGWWTNYNELLNASMSSSSSRGGWWTSDRRSYFPYGGISVVTNQFNVPLGPLITRHAMEAWSDGSHIGIGGQIETKRTEAVLPANTISLYMPNVVYHTAEVFSENFNKVLKRPQEWNPASTRKQHEFFAVMMNSNCGDAVVGITWSRWCIVRELFTYALHNITGKPVHNVGRCPVGPDGAVRAGISLERRVELTKRFAKRPQMKEVLSKFKTPNRDVYAAHKFSLVFENGPADGYATDRVMNAWQAGSVPVYWGGDVETYADVYNPRAYVHCKFDWNILSLIQNDAYRDEFWKQYRSRGPGVADELWRNHMYELLFPSFHTCVDMIKALDSNDAAYEAMLGQAIVPYDSNGNVQGVWSGKRMGEMFRDVLVGLGYDDR